MLLLLIFNNRIIIISANCMQRAQPSTKQGGFTMKTCKKLLAVMLATVLLLSTAAVGAFAAEITEWPDAVYQYIKDSEDAVEAGTIVYSRHGLYLCTVTLSNTWGTLPYEKDKWGYGHGCFDKLGDVVEFSTEDCISIDKGSYVHYNGGLYMTEINIVNSAMAALPDESECFSFLCKLVKDDAVDAPEEAPEYSGPYYLNDNYTPEELEACVQYMGEWSDAPCVINEVMMNKYPIGSVVKWQKKYYECVIDGPAMWPGWEPTGVQSQHWVKIALPGEKPSGYVPPDEVVPEEEQLPAVPKDADGKINGKECIVYYPNWGVYSGYTPETIDWNRATIVNHFAAYVGTVENYEKDGVPGDGEPIPGDAEFILKLVDTWSDLGMRMTHSGEAGMNGIFGEYKWYKENGYDNVKLYLTVGGWSLSFYFSEMIETAENRAEFIQSCMDFLDKYPFFDGIDFDWEYPGVGRDVLDVKSNGSYWPQVTGKPEDKENFTLLLKELREALDARAEADGRYYGISSCFSSVDSTSRYHEFDKIVNYLDYFNIMTYCFASPAFSGSLTSHGSNLSPSPNTYCSAEEAVELFLSRGVPSEKINIGATFTATSWGGVQPPDADAVVGAPSEKKAGPNNEKFYKDFKKLVEGGSFIYGFDEEAKAGYAYNPTTHEYLSVDDENSMRAKASYVKDNNLAGMIIWESRGDYFEERAVRHPGLEAMYETYVEGAVTPEPERTVVMKKEQTNACVDGKLRPTTQYENGQATLQSVNGTYVLPLRYIAEINRMDVLYLGGGQTKVTNKATGEYLIVNKGSKIITKFSADDKKLADFTAEQPVTVKDGITLAPARIICETLRLGVSYRSTSHGSYLVISSDKTIDAQNDRVLDLIENAYALGI